MPEQPDAIRQAYMNAALAAAAVIEDATVVERVSLSIRKRMEVALAALPADGDRENAEVAQEIAGCDGENNCSKEGGRYYCCDTADAITAALDAKDRERGEPVWLVWSNDDRLWWCANRSGYTRFVENAGRYTLAEAVSIAWNHREDCTDDQPNPFPKIAVQPSPELLASCTGGADG